MIEFQPFPKIPRFRRNVAVTEKIDGTNAAVVWAPVAFDQDGKILPDDNALAVADITDQHGIESLHWLLAQSRNRFIHPGGDNHGFARWVIDNAQELTRLGPGYHYGEWWGQGIQRGYGLTEKRFSLFNVSRWDNFSRPACCHVVPLLGYCLPSEVDRFVDGLRATGSVAAPGFKDPEGVVLWHSASRTYCGKILLDNDGEHKGERHEST